MKILEIDYKFITRIYQTLPLEKKYFFKKKNIERLHIFRSCFDKEKG